MTGTQQYSLRWNDYTTYITGAFDALRYEEDLVDVTLFCEGRKIRAHKVVLSACSAYFKDIFKENPAQHPVIIFKNVKYSDLMSLVEFIYQGEVSVLQESLPSFLQTAEMLSIRGLADSSSDHQHHQQHATHHHQIPNATSSSMGQQILQSQSQQNLAASATITAEPVYFTLPSSSTIVPQIKIEPQSSTISTLHTPAHLVNKITLKSTDISIPIGQQPQQQQQQQTSQPQQQQQQQQQPQQQQQHVTKIQLKTQPTPATIAQRTVVGTQPQTQIVTEQANQANSLQELVDSVVTVQGVKKVKRVVRAKPLPAKQTVATTYTEITPEAANQSDNGIELYTGQSGSEQVTAYTDSSNNGVKIQISEYINVTEGINPSTGDSGTYTQQEGFEMDGANITEGQEADERIGQGGFEMEIVDMDVNGMFQDETGEDSVKADIMDESSTGRSKDEKKFKCKECDKAFVTWKSLAMHRHIHSGNTKCKICGAVLSRTANLKRHMKLKHEP